MVNSKDILARLQNGEKAEDIANELINALNDANDAYNKEVAAKKAESETKAKKVADMQDILDLLHDFCIEYYCDSNEDIDEVHATFNEFHSFSSLFFYPDPMFTIFFSCYISYLRNCGICSTIVIEISLNNTLWNTFFKISDRASFIKKIFKGFFLFSYIH